MLKVYNRPGYWRALAWALMFTYWGMRGRVDFRRQRGGFIWEAWPGAEGWRSTSQIPFTLLWSAITGTRFLMDQTHVYIAMEIWQHDQH